MTAKLFAERSRRKADVQEVPQVAVRDLPDLGLTAL